MNPNYEEATMALNFNPEDMGASPPSERQAWVFAEKMRKSSEW